MIRSLAELAILLAAFAVCLLADDPPEVDGSDDSPCRGCDGTAANCECPTWVMGEVER